MEEATTLMAPPLPASSITDIPDVLLEDIFLRLPTAADLARASTARASFRRVIAGHAFLRRYRTLHPPPLLGVLEDAFIFIPAKSPHASAGAARAFAGFDFSCSPFLPSTPGRGWTPIDLFDGRVLLAGTNADEERADRLLFGADESCHFRYRQFLARDLAVCDPVHRRYILLPAVPVHLKDLVVQADLLDLETFLAPGEDEDEEHPLSFRVLCLMQCKLHLLLLVFSSLDGQWHAHTFDQWNAQTTYAAFTSTTLPGLEENRQYVHGCFYWSFRFMHKLLMFDPRTMEFSAVNIPFVESCCTSFIIVEAEKGMLGMLTRYYDEGIEDDEYCLRYCVMRNNQWYLEKVIPLPLQNVTLVGAAGGYLLMAAMYMAPSQENQFGYFSVDLIKTLHVELFAEPREYSPFGRLYAGFPPSLCAPTI